MTIASPSGPTKKQLKPLNSLELEATCGGLSLPNEIMGLQAAVPHETYDRTEYLYRIFNLDGGLWYVGITCGLDFRMDQHSLKDWFPRPALVYVEDFPNRLSVEFAEEWAIWTEGPAANSRRREPDGGVTMPVVVRFLEERAGYLFGANGRWYVKGLFDGLAETGTPDWFRSPALQFKASGRSYKRKVGKMATTHIHLQNARQLAHSKSVQAKMKAYWEAQQNGQ